jgi:hypothetical protein
MDNPPLMPGRYGQFSSFWGLIMLVRIFLECDCPLNKGEVVCENKGISLTQFVSKSGFCFFIFYYCIAGLSYNLVFRGYACP